MNKVTANLIAAKKLIANPNHWIRGVLRSGPCFCAMGAVREVIDPERTFGYSVHKSPEYRYLCAALPKGFGGVPQFNDDPGTNHSDVVALFNRAIELSK